MIELPQLPLANQSENALKKLPRGRLLLGYQQGAISLLDSTSLLAIEKSRRIGLTWALAAKAVLTASKADGEGGMDALYISYAQDMTREFIDACAMWARVFDLAASDEAEIMLKDGDKDIKAFRINFASGFEVMALSSAPRSIRGKQGLLIIDEAAFVDSLSELLKGAMAFVMWGGKVVAVSTHNGAGNPFNTFLEDIRSGQRNGETLRIDFKDALADGLYERICLVTKEKSSPSGKVAWEKKIRGFYGEDADEELDCKPRAGSGSWLDPADIFAATHPEAGEPRYYRGGPCYVGRDIARRNDLSVIWVFEEVAGVMWLRERIEQRNCSFADQQTEFDRIMRDYRVMRAALDQTGMGEVVVEQAQEKYGKSLVEGVIFTGPRRLDIATVLKQRFEAGLIRIPDDDKIKADLRSIKRKGGPTGAPRLVQDGSSDGHGDRFWAAALALGAAGDRVVSFDHEASSQRRAGLEDLQIDMQTGFGVVGAGLDMSGWE